MSAWQRLTGNPSRSIAPLAWGLVPLFLVIGVLIYVFGDAPSQSSNLLTMERSSSGERVWLGSSDIPDRAWSESFVPPNDAVRTALLQELARFRGERVQQGIELEVTAAASNEAGQQVARQIGSALGQYSLGKARDTDERASISFTTLRAAPRDRGMVHALLTALSPYLKGEVWIQYDESANTRSLTLHLADHPHFGDDGTVWYGLDVYE